MGQRVQAFGKDVAPALTQLGFQKRTGLVFTRSLAPDALGWLGLNTVAYRAGPLEVNPVVGVREQRLEHLVAALRGMKWHPYMPSSLSIHLGYLTEAQAYSPFLVSDEWQTASVIEDLVGALERYGLPFMAEHVTLAMLTRRLEKGQVGVPQERTYRLPVAYYLLGESERAREYVDEQLRQSEGYSDAATVNYRAFAARLLERIAS